MEQKNSDAYQADISRSDSTEKFTLADEQERRRRNMQTDIVDAVLYLNDIVGDLHETGKTSETRLEGLQKAVNRVLENIHPANDQVSLNFSNEAGSDGVSLKSDTSLKDSEA